MMMTMTTTNDDDDNDVGEEFFAEKAISKIYTTYRVVAQTKYLNAEYI